MYNCNAYCVVFIVTILQCLNHTSATYVSPMVKPPFIGKEREDLLVFYSFAETINLINHELYRNVTGVQDMLDAFHYDCQLTSDDRRILETMENNPNAFRRPLIVIEGTHRNTRRMVAKKLANRMGAVYMINPPTCLNHLRETFNHEMVLKKAYYSLCMYASAVNVTRIWYNDTIVMAGFWHDQAAYAIARAYELNDMPPMEDPMYKWPSDLLPPDITFFIHSPVPRFEKRTNITFKPRLVEAYRRMREPPVFEIGGILHHDQIRYEIEIHLQRLYKEQYKSILKAPKIYNIFGQRINRPEI